MSKPQPTPRSSAAALAPAGPRPSRIRRDPPPPEKPKSLRAYPTTERESWVVVIGVLLFALAIFVISLGVSEYTK
ncbi:MAG TPA: hypothetical protein VFK50_09965 [Sphingomicrobium sp.]|nr:hypothetical protein [Sphingomicrobium sp.]